MPSVTLLTSSGRARTDPDPNLEFLLGLLCKRSRHTAELGCVSEGSCKRWEEVVVLEWMWEDVVDRCCLQCESERLLGKGLLSSQKLLSV